MGHYPGNPFNYYQIYMYHMPLFFILGGMLMNMTKSPGGFYTGILKKYLLYIVFFYVLIGVVAQIIGHYYPIKIGKAFEPTIFGTIQYALKSNFHGNGYFMVAWFLFAYAIVSSIAFALVSLVTRAIRNEALVSLILIATSLAIGYIGMEITASLYAETKLYRYNLLTQVLVGGSFYLLGYGLRAYIWRVFNVYLFLLMFLAVYALVVTGYSHTSVMSWSKYVDGFYLSYFKAIAGTYSVFFIAHLLARSGGYKLLVSVGASSKTIMTLHVLVFLAMDFMFYFFGVYDISKSSYTSHHYDPYFYGACIAAAVLIPVAVDRAFSTFTRLLRKIKKSPPSSPLALQN